MSDDSDGFGFFTGVSSVELKRSYESLDDGAEGFPELFTLVSAGSVGDEHLGLD